MPSNLDYYRPATSKADGELSEVEEARGNSGRAFTLGSHETLAGKSRS
jgi:hypothetical protein